MPAKKKSPAKKTTTTKKAAAPTKKTAKKTAAKKAPAKATKAAGRGKTALAVGAPAPAFTLKDAAGAPVSLSQYAGDWVVLYFYPRDDTPGCTTEACEFTAMWDEFASLGAKVVGVSPDKEASHQRFIEKYKLRVTLLSDPDKKVLAAYGAYGQKLMYGKPVVGVIRSTVLIDPRGRVAKHWPSVKAAGHAAAVAQALREVK